MMNYGTDEQNLKMLLSNRIKKEKNLKHNQKMMNYGTDEQSLKMLLSNRIKKNNNFEHNQKMFDKDNRCQKNFKRQNEMFFLSL